MVRCTSGDPAAFRAFVEHYQERVFALLSRLVGRGPQVEDLAQETFLRAYRALPRFDSNGAARVSTWLLTIGTRVAQDEWRKGRNADARAHELSVVESWARTDASPEGDSVRSELATAIHKAAAELPHDQRAAFVLSVFHDFSHAEVAEALGIPENTVKTRLFRARERLMQALSPYKDEL